VSDALPQITIIVPTKPGQENIPAVEAARRFDYPKEQLEILVVRGRQPAVQRNIALRAARGELIYFLDDDAMAPPDNLRRGVLHFKDPAVQMVGGPNLCPASAPGIEQVFAVVLASWLAFGPSRARYDSVGATRPSGEKELILCNMMARRDGLLELGGFDEALYPNEENALMDDLQGRGATLLYDPAFIVHRRPRPTLKSFCKMLFTYGRGRAEQFRLHPTPGSVLNFVPPLFVAYLAALLVGAIIPWTGPAAVIARWSAWPLCLYLAIVVLQTVASIPRKGFLRSVLAMPLLVASHVFYGLGFWRGLTTKFKTPGVKPLAEVKLDSMPV